MSRLPARPWVLFIYEGEKLGGCQAYRMVLPATFLQGRGRVVDFAHSRSVYQMAMTSARSNSDGPGRYNIFVFPRGVPNVRTTVHLLRAARKQIVLEVDDDFTNRYRQVVPDNFHKELWAFAREDVTAITCSTRYLADLMATETGKPTYVLPNSVPFSEWAYVPKRQRLTIALTGSDTHGGDWIVVKDVMPEILARYPEVDFLMAGMLPSYFQTLKDRFPNRFEFVPWVAFRNYSRLVGSAHIILCPVDPDDGFNLSKSGLKAIEGMAAGAAVVATDMLIYQDVMEHNRHGLLVPFKPEAWFDAISRLIEDREFRARLGSEAKRHARKKHALDVNADRWWQAYCQIAGV